MARKKYEERMRAKSKVKKTVAVVALATTLGASPAMISEAASVEETVSVEETDTADATEETVNVPETEVEETISETTETETEIHQESETVEESEVTEEVEETEVIETETEAKKDETENKVDTKVGEQSSDNTDEIVEADENQVREGWYQDENGNTYYYVNGSPLKDQWLDYEGYSYYFDFDGIMYVNKVASAPDKETGQWTRFCFDAQGHMVIGWYQDEKGNTYYCDEKGHPAEGLVKIDGETYYFEWGRMYVSRTKTIYDSVVLCQDLVQVKMSFSSS